MIILAMASQWLAVPMRLQVGLTKQLSLAPNLAASQRLDDPRVVNVRCIDRKAT